eukprot:scaffold4138_cov46-Phaeocystis_antarctica.AAC.3
MSHWRSSPCDARAQLPQSRWDTLKVMRTRRAADRVSVPSPQDRQDKAAPRGKQLPAGEDRVLRERKCEHAEARSWRPFPCGSATHGGADKCPSRQYPSVEKPLPPAGGPARTKGSTAKNDYSKRYNSELRVLQREADAKLVLFERQGTLPAVPSGAILKEEGTFVKEEGVPPMPPDAF